jgi:hypothetical protein
MVIKFLRVNDAPDIEVHIIAGDGEPGGMSETAVPPLAPAIANAVFAATGKRIRRIPIDPDYLKAEDSRHEAAREALCGLIVSLLGMVATKCGPGARHWNYEDCWSLIHDCGLRAVFNPRNPGIDC